MAGQLFGRAFITIDGDLIETEIGASLDLGGMEREAKPGTHSADGYVERLKPARIECSPQVDADTRVSGFNFSGATVLFEADTGQQFLVSGAYSVDTPAITAGEGTNKLVIQGAPALEV